MTDHPQANTIIKKAEGKKMSNHREYEKEYKLQAVNLAKQIGSTKAAEELQIPINTLYE